MIGARAPSWELTITSSSPSPAPCCWPGSARCSASSPCAPRGALAALSGRGCLGITFESDANLAEVHIRRLRGTLDDPFENKLLETVRGSGYTLDLP